MLAKILSNLQLAPAFLGTALVISASAFVLPARAIAPPTELQAESGQVAGAIATNAKDSIAQVNDVSQFRDVRPSDWAFQAVRDLVERYACVSGYPDGTFRGDRPLTRYEFAAGANACFKQINLMRPANANAATRADVDNLTEQMQQLKKDLDQLGTRIDKLDNR